MDNFHRWAAGNLLDNTVRGLFAEYLVHQALSVDPGQHRVEWAEHDIVGPGWTAEVKAAAYIQSWNQAKPSRISFKIEKRTSTFYVFALLAEQDRSRVNPEDLSQWRFWLVPTAELPAQKSIGLAALTAGFGPGLAHDELCAAGTELARIPLIGGCRSWVRRGNVATEGHA
jgi:hypothetical protein